METLIEIFSLPFMGRVLLVGGMVSLCAALLGVVLVLKKYTLIGHGLGEVGFASLALAMVVGLPPMAVAVPAVVAAAFFIMWFGQKKGVSGDVMIGVMSTAALSVGVILTSVVKGFNVDVSSYMFGSVLAVSEADVPLSVALSAVVLLTYGLCFHKLFAVAYDDAFARAIGVQVDMIQLLISFLTAVTVVLGMRMMGSMLISSLIIIPALSARRLVKSFKAMVAMAAVISVCCFLMGIVVSCLTDMPAGASVVAVNLIVLGLCAAAGQIRRA